MPDSLRPDTHASLLGMAAFPSLACSCHPYSPRVLTPASERGEGQAASPCVSRVCADGNTAVLLTLLTRGTQRSVSLEKTLPPFSSGGCSAVLAAPVSLPHLIASVRLVQNHGELSKSIPPSAPALSCSVPEGLAHVIGRTFVFGAGRINGKARSRPWYDEIHLNGLSLLRFVLEMFL